MKRYDLLVLPPQTKPVYFIVEREDYDHDSTEEQTKFLYESHSCPVNWLEPIYVHHDGDSDPHGLIRYVASKKADEMPPDQNYGPNERDLISPSTPGIESTNGVIPEPLF